MANAEAEKRLFQILEDFVDGKDSNPLALVDDFSKKDFEFSIKFEGYEGNLNAPAAQFMADFQDVIYRIAALCLHGKPHIRKLSYRERQELEISFKVREGSTEIVVFGIFVVIPFILKTLPEERREPALVGIILLLLTVFCPYGCFVGLGYIYYLSQWKNEKELKDMKRMYNEFRRKPERTEEEGEIFCRITYSIAMEKLSEKYPILAEMIDGYSDVLIKNLAKIGEKIELNGHAIITDGLENVRRMIRKRIKRKRDKD